MSRDSARSQGSLGFTGSLGGAPPATGLTKVGKEKIKAAKSRTDALKDETAKMEERLAQLRIAMELEKQKRASIPRKKEGNIWAAAKPVSNSEYMNLVQDKVERTLAKMSTMTKTASKPPPKPAGPSSYTPPVKPPAGPRGQSAGRVAKAPVTSESSPSTTSSSSSSTGTTSETPGAGSLLQGAYDESESRSGFQQAREEFLRSLQGGSEPSPAPAPARPVGTPVANTLLEGDYDEEENRRAFQQAREEFLQSLKPKAAASTADTGMFNISLAQVPSAPIANAPKASCYHCYRLFFEEKGYMDPVQDKMFCGRECAVASAADMKVSCAGKDCYRTVKRKDATPIESKLYCAKCVVKMQSADSRSSTPIEGETTPTEDSGTPPSSSSPLAATTVAWPSVQAARESPLQDPSRDVRPLSRQDDIAPVVPVAPSAPAPVDRPVSRPGTARKPIVHFPDDD